MIKKLKQTLYIRNEAVELNMAAEFGQNGELIYNQKLDDLAMEEANRIYRKRHNLATIEDLFNCIKAYDGDFLHLTLKLDISKTRLQVLMLGALPTQKESDKIKSSL